jgi:hypothetical protein
MGDFLANEMVMLQVVAGLSEAGPEAFLSCQGLCWPNKLASRLRVKDPSYH